MLQSALMVHCFAFVHLIQSSKLLSEWTNAYPAGLPAAPDSSAMPTEWVDALNATVSSRTILDNPVATNLPNKTPTYPSGSDLNGSEVCSDLNGSEVCSGSYGCRIDGDIWDTPDGYIGISFDDGLLPPSDGLMVFLEQENQITTHFFIGSTIIWYSEEFQKTFDLGHNICVHTSTSNGNLLLASLHDKPESHGCVPRPGQDPMCFHLLRKILLGWMMELIHNSTGGRVPKFWWPPYGGHYYQKIWESEITKQRDRGRARPQSGTCGINHCSSQTKPTPPLLSPRYFHFPSHTLCDHQLLPLAAFLPPSPG
ncbi:hypothetical protein DFH07DRAFT_1029883 [Mycena maculata]|uniref:chitin deacetylase n=1 Tax=Mycena maculata TaxID=230809 RepID=A0AAD7NCE9_9AGAR|nr:hypothetical protein DFH07DRAFT_1029883 [Mycena maculata]